MSIVNYLPQKPARIAVAMSGGVDSSVAAWLLAQQGHELVGLTAWTLNGPGKCCNDALVNAGRVCEMLGMPYDTVDLRAEFAHYVMDYYHNTYAAGLTPNPCVECNRFVKWEALVAYAVNELGVDYVATGHYARLHHHPAAQPSGLSSLANSAYTGVYRPRDAHKDQTYMMARVFRRDLDKTIFPLGDLVKSEVYKIAQDANLPTAYSKESQDICFVLDGQANYMKDVLGVHKGPIVDIDTGKTLGEHEGHYLFTTGQRRGVQVAAGRPIYVIKVDPQSNTVFVGDKHHLETTSFRVLMPNWLVPQYEDSTEWRDGALSNGLRAMVKIRYNTPPVMGTVERSDMRADTDAGTGTGIDELTVTLDEPLPAITPGQIAAFYDESNQLLLGGGYIENHLTQHPFDPSVERELPDLFCGV